MAKTRTVLNRLRIARIRFAMALLLCTQALVPNGFMPVFGEGGPQIMLCSGQGLQRAALPDDSSDAMRAIADALDENGDRPQNDNTPCDYAAASHAAASVPAVNGTQAPDATDTPAVVSNGHLAVGKGLAAPPPPQTGPPLSF